MMGRRGGEGGRHLLRVCGGAAGTSHLRRKIVRKVKGKTNVNRVEIATGGGGGCSMVKGWVFVSST